jgi:hypothetical protein
LTIVIKLIIIIAKKREKERNLARREGKQKGGKVGQ